MQNRFRSKAAWAAIAALLLFILQTYGLLDWIGLTAEGFEELTTLLFAALTAFGIFNNPTDKENF